MIRPLRLHEKPEAQRAAERSLSCRTKKAPIPTDMTLTKWQNENVFCKTASSGSYRRGKAAIIVHPVRIVSLSAFAVFQSCASQPCKLNSSKGHKSISLRGPKIFDGWAYMYTCMCIHFWIFSSFPVFCKIFVLFGFQQLFQLII